MEIIMKHLASLVFCLQVLGKRGLSDSLSTKFGPCRKGPKLSKYSKDMKVMMNQVILAVSGNY